jgi:hypothetical protein
LNYGGREDEKSGDGGVSICYFEGKSDVKNRAFLSSSSSSKVSATQQVRSDIDSSVVTQIDDTIHCIIATTKKKLQFNLF